MLATLFLISGLVSCSPIRKHQVEDSSAQSFANIQKRQLPTVAITGINVYGVQPRLEIRQLEANADQWNLFLLALEHFQQTDQSNLTSYYQIAGIHGRPYVPWDNVPPAPGLDSPGYCAHVSNLFLTWHRPYLALFEQTLYEHAVAVVNQFPAGGQRQRYAAAALTLRLPFWDWAAQPASGQSVYPTSLRSPTVNVTGPNGTEVIPNPLYSYQFHPVSAADFYFNPFASWNETKRYPTSWNDDAVSQNDLIGPILDNSRSSFQERLYNLFTNYDNFTEFGNEAWMNSGVQNADSLESIHDAIHSMTGSNGHMTYLDYSAFDPIFFLHHAMIDRCFALWQALYPDSYVEPMAAVEQTYTTTVGEIEDQTSALEPFFSDQQRDYWTAGSVRNTNTFGYTYPELANGAPVSSIKAAINSLYGNSVATGAVTKRTAGDEIARVLERGESPSVSNIPDEVVDGGHYRQYVANILSQKFALNGSYAIYVFLGDFNDTPTAWATDQTLVGTHAVFAALSSVDAASNPQANTMGSSGIVVTGTVPLTSALVAKVQSGRMQSMDPNIVENYLEQNLHWRVGMFDGTQVPVEDVANLTITVITANVQPAASADQFPHWSNFTELTHITQGKAGGC